jgi:hypothetical protein
MPEWTSCQQSLPNYGQEVLVWNGSVITLARLLLHEGEQYWESDDDVIELISPTHWLPLPEPPAKEK